MLGKYRPLPPVLYKYFPVEEWLPSLLTGESLKFSSRKTFNDPFDSRPAYKIAAREDAIGWIKERLTHIRNPSKRIQQQTQLLRQSGKVRTFGQIESDQILDEIGILCMSESWDNPILWAHYANKHTGICVGFHSDRDVFRLADPITYSSVRPVIERPRDTKDEMLEKAFLTKDLCWETEAEWRVIKQNLASEERLRNAQRLGYLEPEQIRVLTDQQGPNFYRFERNAIESITVGMNISANDEEFVLSTVRAYAPKVHVYRAQANLEKYPLARKQVRLSHNPHLKRG